MAVPDGILLKPGQLTDDERQITARRPVLPE
jgi:HD-GYP domain-containing protein (c-di-GMP phosphodiesterase class II)